MVYIDYKLNELKSKYLNYVNFLENYFVKNKYIYFKNSNMNYSLIPNDTRSNSYLKNYNKFIKDYFENKH